MAFICGILGKRDPEIVRAMLRYAGIAQNADNLLEGESFCLGSSSPVRNPFVIDVLPETTQDGAKLLESVRTGCWKSRKNAKSPIKGAFALVCASSEGQEWVLARDRLGRRPLYYYCGSGFTLFASSLRAILATRIVKPILNLTAVDQFLAFGCVPAPQTVLQGISKVSPGGRVYVKADGRPGEERFDDWRLGAQEKEKREAAQLLLHHLDCALKICSAQMLLWGPGVDSAAIGVLKTDARPLFINLDRGWQDEVRAARDSAKWLGRELTRVSARKLTEDGFWRTIRSLDEPVATASVFPYMLICEQASRYGQRALCGVGADEILGGFPRFRYLQRANRARGLVPSTVFQGILPALPPNVFIRRGGRYLAAAQDEVRSYLSLASIFDFTERNTLYTNAMLAALETRDCAAECIKDWFVGKDLMTNVLMFDLKIGLPELIITPVARLADSFGLSLEFPYLDDDLLDFVNSLSPSTKYGIRSKPLLRHAMKGLLPPAIRLRPQRGFRIPQSGRLVALFEGLSEKILSPERVDAMGLFRWSEVDHIVRRSTHNGIRRRQFWCLFVLLAWLRDILER